VRSAPWRGLLSLVGIFCIAVFPPSAVAATTLEHLYDVSLLAVDQSDGERQKSLRQGLEQVLVRTSGQTDFSGNTPVQEALSNPDAYVQQFSYVSLTEAEKADIKARAESQSHPLPSPATALSVVLPTIRMNASFSPELVKALLRKAQLPLWSSARPSVLVWLVVDGGSGKYLLNQSDNAYSFLLQEAARRGLPVVLPMNDLNDQVALGVNRLWDLDQAAIAEASQRYGEGSVLVGRIAHMPTGQWQGNWLYLLKGQSQLIDGNDEDTEAFITHGIDAVVQAQVQRFGISPTSLANKVNLEISGVDSLKAYADTLTFLKSLDLVTSVAVTSVHDTTLRCALEIEGESSLLQELTGLGHVLISEDPPEPATPTTPTTAPQLKVTTETPTLHYRFSAQ